MLLIDHRFNYQLLCKFSSFFFFLLMHSSSPKKGNKSINSVFFSKIERREFAVFDGGILCFLPQELILGDLKAETLYSVSVAAYTTKGDGAHSKAKLVQTPGIGKHMSSIHFSAPDLVAYSRIDRTVSCARRWQ